MTKGLILLCLLSILSPPTLANKSVDQTFTKPQPWGEWFSNLFGREGSGKSYAIVVGVNRFNEYKNLNIAQDPIKVKNYLLNEAGFNYVRLITNDQVNLRKLRQIMEYEMPKMLKPNDRFVFYWQGHGATDESGAEPFGYLPVSGSPKDRFDTMLDMRDLTKWDKKLKVKQALYLLDACFSGFAGYQLQTDNSRELTIEQIDRPSRQILTAGSSDEQTLVLNKNSSSVFTTALIDGLNGDADSQFKGFNKDGIVSVQELVLYIQRRVASESLEAGWDESISPQLSRLNRYPGDFFFFSGKTIEAAPATKIKLTNTQKTSVTAMSGNSNSRGSTSVEQPRRPINLSNVAGHGIDRIFYGDNRLTFSQAIKNTFNISNYNKSYAVVVGISDYTGGLTKRPSTRNDAIRIKDYLINEAGFDYVHLITEEQATLQRLHSVMTDEISNLAGANDRFVFYWSGHGVTLKRNQRTFGYLPLSVTSIAEYSAMLKMQDLGEWDSALQAKQTLYLLDVCFSSGVGFQVKGGSRIETIQQVARPSRQVLTGCLPNEKTIAGIDFGGSLFTTAIIDGLKGAADFSFGQFKKDGIVTAMELELYTKQRVNKEVQARHLSTIMTPSLSKLSDGQGDFFFVY